MARVRTACVLMACVGWVWLATSPAHAAPNALPVPEGARVSGVVVDGEPQVEARLLIDRDALAAGEEFRVGVLFELRPGWHIYWRNPGDAGLPTKISWRLDGAAAGPLRWPAPEVFDEGEGLLTTFGYQDELLLFSDARVSADTRGEIEVAADVEYLACREECIPASASLRRRVLIGEHSRPASDRVVEVFQRHSSRVPLRADTLDLDVEVLYSQNAIRPNDQFRAAIAIVPCPQQGEHPSECPALRALAREPAAVFVPDLTDGIELDPTDSRTHPRTPSGWLVTLEGRAGPDDPGSHQRLAGVMALERAGGSPIWVEIDEALPRARPGAEVTQVDHPWLAARAQHEAPTGLSVWRALVLALLGGVILNLMPCVLPVLAIKVFGVTHLAHEGRRTVLLHGVAYTTGILATMLVLAGVVIGLQAAGTAVGWGFQFQEPLFIVALSVVLLVFALNFFGAFEIESQGGRLGQIGMSAVGLRRSFFDGLLAVVVATPCTAPFLGTAVGFALASPPYVIAVVFCAIGLGLALPYVLVTLIPGWARIVPHPGPWMQVVRGLLGFGLLATVVWLLWLVGGSFGVDGMTGLLVFLLAVAAATWLYGSAQRARPAARVASIAAALALIVVTGSFAVRLDQSTQPTETAHGDWPPFDPVAVSEALAAGRPVFVDFTADWCITCGVNERLVIGSAEVRDELARLDVATFVADWTRRDERIRAELARHGRAGVPMYLVYSPRSPDSPTVLPELLTIELLVDALRVASKDSTPRAGLSPPRP